MQSGSKSFSILENMTYFIILIGILLAFMFIVFGIYIILKKKRDMIRKKAEAAAKDFFWNGFIQSAILTYLKSFVSFALP